MKVKDVVDAILGECKTPPFEKTCDVLIAGDWQNEVTGIATTFMATVDVIRESIARGANLIITHEPTFFHRLGQDRLAAAGSGLPRKNETDPGQPDQYLEIP